MQTLKPLAFEIDIKENTTSTISPGKKSMKIKEKLEKRKMCKPTDENMDINVVMMKMEKAKIIREKNLEKKSRALQNIGIKIN